MGKKKQPDNNVCRNKKATFKYQLLEKVECGIMLLGTEVKSLRAHGGSLDEAYARIEGGELWLIGCHIATYKYGHDRNHEPLRRRKLLIHRQELRKLLPKVEQKGLTLVPLQIYFNARGLAKVTVAVAQGKTHADKRQSLKSRDHEKEIARAMRRGK